VWEGGVGKSLRVPDAKSGTHRPLPPAVAADLAMVLRTRRERAGHSQERIAEASGVSVQMVRRLEAGRANPTLGTLYSVAAALGTNMASLLAEARA
jgi:ribosome-binding protein aMBF1 (putative translation factor)